MSNNGLIPDSPLQPHVGAIVHHGPGRTDDTPIHVKGESFVIPADVVSGLGQGNTLAGFKALEKMFPPARAAGGAVPIIAAGGEYVVDPAHVKRLGGGNVKRGHGVLEHMVLAARKDHIKTLKKLPGPVRG